MGWYSQDSSHSISFPNTISVDGSCPPVRNPLSMVVYSYDNQLTKWVIFQPAMFWLLEGVYIPSLYYEMTLQTIPSHSIPPQKVSYIHAWDLWGCKSIVEVLNLCTIKSDRQVIMPAVCCESCCVCVSEELGDVCSCSSRNGSNVSSPLMVMFVNEYPVVVRLHRQWSID